MQPECRSRRRAWKGGGEGSRTHALPPGCSGCSVLSIQLACGRDVDASMLMSSLTRSSNAFAGGGRIVRTQLDTYRRVHMMISTNTHLPTGLAAPRPSVRAVRDCGAFLRGDEPDSMTMTTRALDDPLELCLWGSSAYRMANALTTRPIPQSLNADRGISPAPNPLESARRPCASFGRRDDASEAMIESRNKPRKWTRCLLTYIVYKRQRDTFERSRSVPRAEIVHT
ncbi:hypothetical protein OF83DRAFT_730707 [Amylostereum chailletii]|nr:hypothetical protein OF83DRAFT_730707 [Amylostereum chailletii]